MKQLWMLWFCSLMLGCGVASPGPGDSDTEPGTVDCHDTHCGEADFRQAILLAQSAIAIQYDQPGGSRAQEDLGVQIEQLNALLAKVFGAIDHAASTDPEVADATRQIWRQSLGAHDVVLQLSTIDQTAFDVQVDRVASGAAIGDDPAVFGHVFLDSSGALEVVELFAQVDTLTDELTGMITLTAEPHRADAQKTTYDVFIDSGDGLTSYVTTYWSLGEGTGVLRQLADFSLTSDSGDILARWSSDGGRYDAVVEGDDPEWGELEIVFSECWASDGELTFNAALQSTEEGMYGAVSGDEASCAWSLVDAYPEGLESLEEYFDEDGWAAYDALSPMPESPPESD